MRRSGGAIYIDDDDDDVDGKKRFQFNFNFSRKSFTRILASLSSHESLEYSFRTLYNNTKEKEEKEQKGCSHHCKKW